MQQPDESTSLTGKQKGGFFSFGGGWSFSNPFKKSPEKDKQPKDDNPYQQMGVPRKK